MQPRVVLSNSDSENSNSSLDIGTTVNTGRYETTTPVSGVTCRWSKCGQMFVQLDELASHVTSDHANSGPGGLFYCGWEGCGRGDRGFNARYKMLVHVRTHTNEKPHHCYQCDKSFSRAENLKIHARSHTGERPYVCPIPGCGKAYSNSSDRFKHTRTHLIDKPYVCKIPGCAKRYTDPSSLRKHVKTYRHFPSTPTEKTTLKNEENYKQVETVFKMADDYEDNQSGVELQNNTNQSAFHRVYDYRGWDTGYNSIQDTRFSSYLPTSEITMENIKNRVNSVQYEMFRNWLDRDHVWEPAPYWNAHYDVRDIKNRCVGFSLGEQDTPLDLSMEKQSV